LLWPEFFGKFIVVNGVAWPYLNVEPRKYRFRFLNATNARAFNLRLVNDAGLNQWLAPLCPGCTENAVSPSNVYPLVFQIGSDGGYLASPVQLQQTADQLFDGDIADDTTKLFLAQAERVDVVIDFSQAAGQNLTFINDALTPYPAGAAPDPGADGLVMQFHVGTNVTDTTNNGPLPTALNYLPTRIAYNESTPKRHMVITEIEDPTTGTPTVALINNTCWDPRAPGQRVTENPFEGATEIWEITNMTPDTHPIHLHLIEFNLLDRQLFDKNGYMTALDIANGAYGPSGAPGSVIIGDAALRNGRHVLGPPPTCPNEIVPFPQVSANGGPTTTPNPQVIPNIHPYLRGEPIPPLPPEAGFKDTIRVKHNTVTRFLVQFSPNDPADGVPGPVSGTTLFNSTYVTPSRGCYPEHCHITEHEDQEMMRPYKVCPANGSYCDLTCQQ
jgi:spore coat protein A, manganese oxidase